MNNEILDEIGELIKYTQEIREKEDSCERQLDVIIEQKNKLKKERVESEKYINQLKDLYDIPQIMMFNNDEWMFFSLIPKSIELWEEVKNDFVDLKEKGVSISPLFGISNTKFESIKDKFYMLEGRLS